MRVTPVAVFVAVTVAPGTAADWASVTSPLISPPPICAHAGGPANANSAVTHTSSRIERIPAGDLRRSNCISRVDVIQID